MTLTAITIVVAGGLAGSLMTAPPAIADDEHKMQVDVIGCVQLESDYRKSIDPKAGTSGSNDFVLVNAIPSPKQVTKSPVGTSGQATTTYRLNGKEEQDFKRVVGRQVEILGTVEAGKNDKAGSKLAVSNLPKLTVTGWHDIADYCPAK
jgi:hypothetical protein